VLRFHKAFVYCIPARARSDGKTQTRRADVMIAYSMAHALLPTCTLEYSTVHVRSDCYRSGSAPKAQARHVLSTSCQGAIVMPCLEGSLELSIAPIPCLCYFVAPFLMITLEFRISCMCDI